MFLTNPFDNFIHPFEQFSNPIEKFIHPFEQLVKLLEHFVDHSLTVRYPCVFPIQMVFCWCLFCLSSYIYSFHSDEDFIIIIIIIIHFI